jgi:hypothetical protein
VKAGLSRLFYATQCFKAWLNFSLPHLLLAVPCRKEHHFSNNLIELTPGIRADDLGLGTTKHIK